MTKTILRFFGSGIRAGFALIGIFAMTAAVANYTATQGAGTTFGSIVVSTVHYAQQLICDSVTPANCATVKPASTAAVATDSSMVTQLNPTSPGIIATGGSTTALSFPTNSNSQYPINSVTTTPTPLVAKGTGTTGAVTGTLTPPSTATAYVCGFAVSYVGGTAQVGPLVLSGLLGGSFTFQIPLSTATGGNNFSQSFNPCIPASAVNTPIVMTTVADGTASAVDVNIWGYGL